MSNTVLDTPEKSEYHEAEYRVVRLTNGLTALLISDLEGANNDDMNYKDYEAGCSSAKRVKRDVWKASCGLCVGVGSFSDPPEVPGLAHFLQRIIFMGSGNHSNGYLSAALDRFVQLFIEPLIKKDDITREREAVQREFQWSTFKDKNTKGNFLSFIARPDHPASKFLRGSSISLNNDIDDDKLYEKLHEFRKRHYSAHRMMLAIQARSSLSTLEQCVTKFCNTIPNYDLPPDDFNKFEDSLPFDTDAFKKMYHIKVCKDVNQIHVTWALPSLLNLYRSKPCKYISWIIEHKGKDSLTSYLRKKMWGLDVFSGTYNNDNVATVELTDEGVKHQREVLDAVFSFINLVKRTGPQESIYNELIKIGKNNFRFFSQHDGVFNICKSMHFYPSRDYVPGKYIYFECNSEAIQKCLDFLVPESINIMTFNNEVRLCIVEQFSKVHYTSTEISEESIKRWKFIEPLPNFHLPSSNEFLANDFSIIPVSAEASKYPVKIHQDLMSEIWFCPKFHWPMCHINLHIVSPLTDRVAKNAVRLQMYCNVIKYLILEDLHPAVTAGFSYEIDVNEQATGIIIQIRGFNENLPVSIHKFKACVGEVTLMKTFLRIFHIIFQNFYIIFQNFKIILYLSDIFYTNWNTSQEIYVYLFSEFSIYVYYEIL
ncbi:Nardilysin [Trachymyrmex cornetzi]|uniref:Nardilysin n=1 Tax=Trachymyrmex cornetzi TaxID=471704 RepID=A0A151JMN3_9HYME|nr:Nardilysin [Trachymyrmex cornetzi]